MRMDNNIAIEIDGVGKQYRLGLVGTGSLQHDLNRWWQTAILRKEDPYLKIGEVNDRSKKGTSDYVWALKDISFKVEQGDVVGIIGKNGAGKSTLLKLLSHITAPSVGHIRYRGRIASLLEVGTGFHPEMTARQNIYMNGSIMGMTRHEITSKLDEIVDFAGIERYLDTPVKRFSSGMTVRLGFAVAAFLEPEILVVDEVLAVGDAEFQKKAIGKMKDVSSSGGRTVLFVSHNMASINALCNNGIVLENGQMAFQGPISQAINYYLSSGSQRGSTYHAMQEKPIMFLSAQQKNEDGNVTQQFGTDRIAIIEFTTKNDGLKTVRGNFSVSNSMGIQLMIDRFDVPIGIHVFQASIETKKLLKGIYHISLALDTFGVAAHDVISNILTFEIVDLGSQYSIKNDAHNGMVASFANINIIK